MKKEKSIKFQRNYERIARAFINNGIRWDWLRNLNRKIHKNFNNKNKIYKKEKVKIGNNILYLDKFDSENLSFNPNYEKDEFNLVKKQIKLGDVVIDVGANIGYFTVLFAELVGYYGRVYAFEPDPENFKILKKNIEVNKYENVVLINKAVLEKDGKLKLYLGKEDMGNHKIYSGDEKRAVIEIEGISLDNYFKDINVKIDFIKIDVEGSEPGVISSGKELLRQSNIRIMTEYYPKLIKEYGYDYKKYLQDLLDLGFRVWDIQNKKEEINSLSSEDFFKRLNPELGYPTNLFCVK